MDWPITSPSVAEAFQHVQYSSFFQLIQVMKGKILLERVVKQGLLSEKQVMKRDRPKCVERVINRTRHGFPRSTGELTFSRVCDKLTWCTLRVKRYQFSNRSDACTIFGTFFDIDIDIVTLSSFHAYLSKASSNDSSPAGGTLG